MNNHLYSVSLFISLAGILLACQPNEWPARGDVTVPVFTNEHLYFNPELNKEGLAVADNGVMRLFAGRLLLKKVTAPVYERAVKASVHITLKSAGDRWDKSGSCFVLKDTTGIDFLDIQAQTDSFPLASAWQEQYPGVQPTETYRPVKELLRFMTPFGIGAYNDSMELRRPVYIPRWEEQVEWQRDVSELLTQMQGEFYVGVWVDTWTAEGYEVSVELQYDETEAPCLPKKAPHVLAITNTVPYGGGQQLPDFFAETPLSVDFHLPENAQNPRLYYTITGHGGHSGGDEFVRNRNRVLLNGQPILDTIPWRDDCASFRRFNPGSGVWLITDTTEYIDWEARAYREKVIEERQASSDLSRSNWCPGSQVNPYVLPLADLPAGTHTLQIELPDAQPSGPNEFNHWLVSAYLVYE